MTRKTTEHSRRRDEEGPLENPTRERALAFIQRWDPELNQTITEHANRSIHHSQAAWTNEPVTLSFDRDGAAVEVTNQDSTAFRIFEAMRDAAREHSSREEKTQAAQELVEMMTQPYRAGLENLPRERAALRARLEGNLGRIAGEAADCLTLEAEAHSPTGEMFCNQTENMAAISRDLSRAASGMEDFDGALVKRNRTLWEKLRQGDSTLDLFPINGQENPQAAELLETFAKTTRGWSWQYRKSIQDEISESATSRLAQDLQARERDLREQGRDEEARDTACLRKTVGQARDTMESALTGIARGRDETKHRERFKQALQTIAQAVNNPEEIRAG